MSVFARRLDEDTLLSYVLPAGHLEGPKLVRCLAAISRSSLVASTLMSRCLLLFLIHFSLLLRGSTELMAWLRFSLSSVTDLLADHLLFIDLSKQNDLRPLQTKIVLRLPQDSAQQLFRPSFQAMLAAEQC